MADKSWWKERSQRRPLPVLTLDLKTRPWVSADAIPDAFDPALLTVAKAVDLLQSSLFASSHLYSLLCRRLTEHCSQFSNRQLHPRHPMRFVQPGLPPSFSLYRTRQLLLKLCFWYPWQLPLTAVHLPIGPLHCRLQCAGSPSFSEWYRQQRSWLRR